MARINHLAVLVAAIVFFVWGAIWFTVLGPQWMAAAGVEKGTGSPVNFVASFVLGWVVAYVIAFALMERPGGADLRTGAVLGAFAGLGLYATMLLNQYLFEHRPMALWFIDAGYVVIGFAIIGAIEGVWKRAGKSA